jgi:hypothetical protein
MGQYQQWLHYQAIDRRLRTQVETLEAELAQLQEHLHILEQQQPEATPLTDNPIVQVLLANLHAHNAPPKSTTRNTNGSTTSLASDLQSSEHGDTISPALLSWGGLPNFGPQEIKEPFPVVEQALPLTSHPEIELLPEDMMAFFDEHAQTDPQIELPWWLRNITISSNNKQGSRPIDQNSIRTNRLVQRWIERWGRQPSTTLKPTEKEEESASE